MDKALIHKDGADVIVSAIEVLNNLSLYHDTEFKDPEEQFRVELVRDSKGHNGPYFRLYLTREEYAKLSPDRKQKYDFLRNQRHYRESEWHRDWKDVFSKYGENEYYIYSSGSNKYKRTDFYYDQGKTCVEFQHSYIDNDFEQRNEFYSKEGLNIIWLYDLTKMSVKNLGNGYFEILENNAKGFFRIAENPNNLKDYPVFIQVKGDSIYRVKELKRKEIANVHKSTIRYFKSCGVYTEQSFIDGVLKQDDNFKASYLIKKELFTLYDLWDKSYSVMVVTDGEKTIIVNRNANDEMHCDLSNGTITFKYVDWIPEDNRYVLRSNKEYSVGFNDAATPKWKLIHSFLKK